jgi:predicted Zn-dependent peptidase
MRSGTVPKASAPPQRLNEVKVETIDVDKEQSLIVMGFMTTDLKDKDKYALDIIGSVLSGYSGRLFGSLRQRLPIAYTLGTIHKTMVSSGFFALYVATAKDKISITQKELLGQISTIRKSGISDEELLHAARELKTAYEIKLQTNDYFSQATAIDELYGLGYDNVNKYEACINKVTKEDVKAVVDKYFDLNAYAETIVRGEK